MFKPIVDWIKETLIKLGFSESMADDIDLYVLLGTIIVFFLTLILKLIKWWIQSQNKTQLFTNFNQWLDSEAIYFHTKFFIPPYFQRTPPSKEIELKHSKNSPKRKKLIPYFLNNVFHGNKSETNKYYLVLADSGMGKTTFLINLYLRYSLKWKPSGIKYNIILLPLSKPGALKSLREMDSKEKANTILLLDAFDEDNQAIENYKRREANIIQQVDKFKKVIITCRTQFFSSQDEELGITKDYKYFLGQFHSFQKLYITPFSDLDVLRYLHKRYKLYNPFNWKKLLKAWRVVEKAPSLMARPMILSFIPDLLEAKQNFDYSFQIYEVMIAKWMKREADKFTTFDRFGTREKFIEQYYIFHRDLALHLFLNGNIRKDYVVHKDEKISTESIIQLSDLEDNRTLKKSDWRHRSLLNRNPEGYYKFSHKSILEYILAYESFDNPKLSFLKYDPYKGLNNVQSFLQEMLAEKILKKATGTYTLEKSKTNKSLNLLTPKDLHRIEIINISNIKDIRSHLLPFLPNTTKELIIHDRNSFPYLYLFYLLDLVYSRKYSRDLENPSILALQNWLELHNWLESDEYSNENLWSMHDPLGRKDRSEFLKLIKQLGFKYLSEHIEWVMLYKNENIKRFNLLETLKFMKDLEIRSWVGLIERIKQKDTQFIRELENAEKFMGACHAISFDIIFKIKDIKVYF